MRRGQLTFDWRGKVNPLFVVGIQYGRFMLRLFNELKHADSEISRRVPSILAQACKETIPLLPPSPREAPRVKEELIGRLKGIGEDDWLTAPEVREPLAEIATRIQGAPKALLSKGLDRPHWWMTQDSWSVESLLNVLALLHFKTPLPEMKQRVIRGDLHLFADLFYIDRKAIQIPRPDIQKVLKNVTDEATRMLGTALLLRKDPPGYQLNLRMVLFFGWDFGLSDLSNDELYTFLYDIGVIPTSYDPETLRKYRNRLRRLITQTGQLD